MECRAQFSINWNPIIQSGSSSFIANVIMCYSESGGHISKAQNIVNMDREDGDITISSFLDIDSGIQISFLIFNCGEFTMQNLFQHRAATI